MWVIVVVFRISCFASVVSFVVAVTLLLLSFLLLEESPLMHLFCNVLDRNFQGHSRWNGLKLIISKGYPYQPSDGYYHIQLRNMLLVFRERNTERFVRMR